jgi:NAD(P)-dependent dehydrogenase (short-subunit alcohol dehydrogenase family)
LTALADLDGRVAVVTGGASGIGRGIATRLADQGCAVVIADLDRRVDEVAAEIGAAAGMICDVSDAAAVQALAREVVDRHGTVHVLCNNAGVGPMALMRDMTERDWRFMVDVNLYGVLHGLQAFLPILLANEDGGHVVNTASLAGLIAGPKISAYAATKFAVVGLTESLALELEMEGAKVGASVLCPGPVHSNIKASMRHRSEEGGLFDVDISRPNEHFDASDLRWMQPEEAGDVVVDAIRTGKLYAITHPEMWPAVQERYERLAAAFGQELSPR